MCGLLGYIGTSKDQIKTEQLVTSLFDKTQTRGIDAAGFYCVSEFEDNKVYYHKQPGPSVNLINDKIFKDLWSNKINLGLFHCRAASSGVGVPADNINNHPFVSEDLSKAVIHNGIISKSELNYLKNFYQMKSTCDSEIILRILEQEDKDYFDNLSFFLTSAQDSHFAVAYSHNKLNERKLVLFRNKHRPLFFVDLIDELGQIFFFSTEEIFFESLEDIRKKNIEIKSNKITEIKSNEIFEFVYKKNGIIEKFIYNSEKEEIHDDITSNYYSIINNVNKKFNLNINLNQENNLEDDLIECIFEMKNQQNKLLSKISDILCNKNVNYTQYEDAILTIEEINKKLNYINLKL